MEIKDPAYLADLKKRPVFPLHIHWDGSLSVEDIFAFYEKQGKELFFPEKDINGRTIEYQHVEDIRIHSPKDLQRFFHDLRKYSIIDVFGLPVGCMQTEEDLKTMALSHCAYLHGQNVPYAETRFAPQYHGFQGLSLTDAITAAAEGFIEGREATGVDVRLIICIGREAEPALGLQVAKAAVKCNKRFPKEVLGIDLACEEGAFPPERHVAAYEFTFDTPLRRTAHAGEMCDERTNLRNIRTAVRLLKVNGLGHAIPLYKDKELVAEVVEKGIRIESNPLSNAFFFDRDIRDPHLDELVEAGVLVTINPDDPGMIPNGDLVHNLYHLGERYGDDFVETVRKNGIRAAWGLTDAEKKEFLKD